MPGVQFSGAVGPTMNQDGGNPFIRQGKSGEVVTQDAHGRYYEASVRGNLFFATNQAAQAVSVALATAYTGLVISNPILNNKNIVLLGVNFALTVAPAAIASLHLIGGNSTANVTHTAAITPQNCLIGSPIAASAKVDSQATIATPVYVMPLVSGFTAAALPSMTPGWIDLGGSIILMPGSFIGIGALTAVTGFGGFLWEEVSI